MSLIPDDLDTTRRDRAIALVKSALSAVPGVGSIFLGMIADDIPRQRMDRIVDYLRYLAEIIEHHRAELKEKASKPELLDLIEEGALRAARATSNERLERVSLLVAHGIAGDDRDMIEAKRLLEHVSD